MQQGIAQPPSTAPLLTIPCQHPAKTLKSYFTVPSASIFFLVLPFDHYGPVSKFFLFTNSKQVRLIGAKLIVQVKTEVQVHR